MKTSLHHPHWSRPSQRGSAVVVVFTLIVIMMMLAAANTVTLNWLKSEVRLVEKRQTMRLTALHTHAPAQTAIDTNTPAAQ